ncbi:MAG TPA: lysozyme inhibitor LprI family protein [Candidatus Obscuribacterales bacterium]
MTIRLLRFGLILGVAIAPSCGWMGDTAERPTPPPAAEAPSEPTSPDEPAPEPTPEPSAPEPTPITPFSPGEREVGVVNGVDCQNAQTQSDMNLCAGETYKLADDDLNRLYQQVLNQLPQSDRPALIEAQEAWLAYRDTNCDFEASLFEGGSIQPLMYYSCLERMTDERIEVLQQ